MSDPLFRADDNVNGTLADTTHGDREVLIHLQPALVPATISRPSSKSLFMLLAGIAATAAFFLLGARLTATALLGVLSVLGLFPEWRQHGRWPLTLFCFCALSLAIQNQYLSVGYPFSNIFILTGLLCLFFVSGRPWQELHLAPGTARKWSRPALLCGLLLAALILAIYFQRPEWVGKNPTPRQWPVDVLFVVALGYATFSMLMEETIFRGVLLAAAQPHVPPGLAIVAQASVFAAAHYAAGFPTQAVGALLTFGWGAAAGWITLKAGSIYPAYILHFVLVLVLFLVLAFAS
ncbi:MAG: CPBP family intramembrane metalloprotease [candidate division KSB1 bacterium]|nr:CPBP family intramembrane metalloprotease [candidate division KSB1 bacterium]MDZ7275494.1 CPBP family intramembrane metalloprotease [candidate division KSB1 bacterium]MDZ7286194.1 CPBP family intramembrane metalloprotease [candidate division KSB1 bacterium]MDZ7296420.1 CPBP family intramembrane metalloprotease [candidate division KSB1 bacterium]MDZ7308950.1 CPBP family intramembrane metalloprotease [candidate division KSB1 bacterium]